MAGNVALMCLGPIVFDLLAPNLTEVERNAQRALAKHDIINGSPLYEDMGEDEIRTTLTGNLRPINFENTKQAEDLIEAARLAAIPLPLIRGDLKPLGIVIIESYRTVHSELYFDGVGREVALTIELVHVDPSSVIAAGVETVLRLF